VEEVGAGYLEDDRLDGSACAVLLGVNANDCGKYYFSHTEVTKYIQLESILALIVPLHDVL
jgi:hypothetical protein